LRKITALFDKPQIVLFFMIVIKIENLWKEYRLGVIGHGTLTHDLQSWWARIRDKEDPNAQVSPMLAGQEKQIEGDRFWALQNVNLEIKEGEILGIIGKNGAGKSTLLKILSRVTAPTRGNIRVKGRIASLLEVGTGFHSELTGRENIFMNGAILGMAKQEIRSKLDEIIDFSGVEDFVDTPVKRYSSGMYVRLAFAVAAHLEPEILVIDEVLAVGDAEFQKKCLGKMGEISRGGRTVLFVSHNMGAVSRLCSRGVCFETGRLIKLGETSSVVGQYLRVDSKLINEKEWSEDDAPGNSNVKLRSVKITTQKNKATDIVEINESIFIVIIVKSKKCYPDFGISVVVKNSQGEIIIHSSSLTSTTSEVTDDIWLYKMEIPPNLLNVGRYSVSVASDIPNKEMIFHVKDILSFDVVSRSKNISMYSPTDWKGLLSPESVRWEKVMQNNPESMLL